METVYKHKGRHFVLFRPVGWDYVQKFCIFQHGVESVTQLVGQPNLWVGCSSIL